MTTKKEAIQMAVELRRKGKSRRQIAAKLNAAGVRSKMGKIKPCTVAYFLRLGRLGVSDERKVRANSSAVPVANSVPTCVPAPKNARANLLTAIIESNMNSANKIETIKLLMG